jgi:hypothetical protein
MPYRDVTPGLMALIDKITAQSQAVGGVADIPAGEGLQNVPVGTMLAQIEQATKIMAAAHKGMHTAQSLELELIVDLFRSHPEDFWKSNKVSPKGYWNEDKLLAALDNCNLIPVSDPNVPSHIHRISKALALVNLIQMPAFTPLMDAKETLKRCLAAIREDSRGLLVDPPPASGMPPIAPDKLITAQARAKDAETKAMKPGSTPAPRIPTTRSSCSRRSPRRRSPGSTCRKRSSSTPTTRRRPRPPRRAIRLWKNAPSITTNSPRCAIMLTSKGKPPTTARWMWPISRPSIAASTSNTASWTSRPRRQTRTAKSPSRRRRPRRKPSPRKTEGQANKAGRMIDMTDDGTYFWPESSINLGICATTGFQILGPPHHESFNAALTRYRLIRLAA